MGFSISNTDQVYILSRFYTILIIFKDIFIFITKLIRLLPISNPSVSASLHEYSGRVIRNS